VPEPDPSPETQIHLARNEGQAVEIQCGGYIWVEDGEFCTTREIEKVTCPSCLLALGLLDIQLDEQLVLAATS